MCVFRGPDLALLHIIRLTHYKLDGANSDTETSPKLQISKLEPILAL
jgi:hypothetical protein